MVELLVQLARDLPAGILVLGILYVQWQTLQLLRQVHRMTEDLHRWHDVPDPRDPSRKVWYAPAGEQNHWKTQEEALSRIERQVNRLVDRLDWREKP